MKIEPMTIAEIQLLFVSHSSKDYPVNDLCEQCRLILAWAHERALSRFYKAELFELQNEKMFNAWLGEILDEIGWPKEGR